MLWQWTCFKRSFEYPCLWNIVNCWSKYVQAVLCKALVPWLIFPSRLSSGLLAVSAFIKAGAYRLMSHWHLNNNTAWWDKFKASLSPVGSYCTCCLQQPETSLGAAAELCCLWNEQSHILHLSWGFQNSNFHLLARAMLPFLYFNVQKPVK